MKMTLKVPRGGLPEAERVAAQANLTRLDPDHLPTERSEDKIRIWIEESDEIAPSTREDGWRPASVQLVYELGEGREIDLGSWDASDLAEVVFKVAMKSEKEFRRLLAELEAVVEADESHEHA